MKLRTLLLSILAMMMMPAWAGGAKEEIASCITQLYDAIAKRAEGGTTRFACKNWWKTVAEVEKKDQTAEEIGFFNDDLWTQMQDSNPDRFEVRDLKFLQFDEQKGTALVDFKLWSEVQTIHQRFEFCREDGAWRVHDIIRLFPNEDGSEDECDMMRSMTAYLDAPAENVNWEYILLPDLNSDSPLDLTEGMDDHKKYFPAWNKDDHIQNNDGELCYNISTGYDMPLKQMFEPLPGKPIDMNEVARVILKDLNGDGHSDCLICLGRYGDDKTMYYDAYVWDVDYENYTQVEGFRNIPNPRIDRRFSGIVGRRGNDCEMWDWTGLAQIERTSVLKDHY